MSFFPLSLHPLPVPMADSSVVKGQGELRTNHFADDGNYFFQRHPAKALPMAVGTSDSERQASRLLGREQRTGHQITPQTDDIWLEPFPPITATSVSPASQRASRPIPRPDLSEVLRKHYTQHFP